MRAGPVEDDAAELAEAEAAEPGEEEIETQPPSQAEVVPQKPAVVIRLDREREQIGQNKRKQPAVVDAENESKARKKPRSGVVF